MQRKVKIVLLAAVLVASIHVLGNLPDPNVHTFAGEYHWTSSESQPNGTTVIILSDPALPSVRVVCAHDYRVAISDTQTVITCK